MWRNHAMQLPCQSLGIFCCGILAVHPYISAGDPWGAHPQSVPLWWCKCFAGAVRVWYGVCFRRHFCLVIENEVDCIGSGVRRRRAVWSIAS